VRLDFFFGGIFSFLYFQMLFILWSRFALNLYMIIRGWQNFSSI
jgi:hypothetical protein